RRRTRYLVWEAPLIGARATSCGARPRDVMLGRARHARRDASKPRRSPDSLLDSTQPCVESSTHQGPSWIGRRPFVSRKIWKLLLLLDSLQFGAVIEIEIAEEGGRR